MSKNHSNTPSNTISNPLDTPIQQTLLMPLGWAMTEIENLIDELGVVDPTIEAIHMCSGRSDEGKASGCLHVQVYRTGGPRPLSFGPLGSRSKRILRSDAKIIERLHHRLIALAAWFGHNRPDACVWFGPEGIQLS